MRRAAGKYVQPIHLDQVKTYAVGIGPSKASVNKVLVAAAHARCLEVHPYTVNDTSEMAALLRLGVDGMFTNYLDRLTPLLVHSRCWQCRQRIE